MIELIKGDCLTVMDELIAKGVVVDAVITDPPYGTTACKWDSIIPFDEMWLRLNKLIKPNGAIVLFGSEPFSSTLRMSNIENYRHGLIWNKKQAGNPFIAKLAPLKIYENIEIFSKKKVNYYPIMEERGKERLKGGCKKDNSITGTKANGYKQKNNTYYPTAILEFSNANKKGKVHPTQKPVALMEYLIKTYTNEGELVLDFTMGSFTTAIACINTKRDFIGIELDDGYFEIGTKRVNEHLKTLDYTPKICYNV